MSFPRYLSSITLVELLVAIALVGLLIVGISTLDTFARFHLMTSDRRAKLQNDASFCIEQISNDGMRGIGRLGDSAVQNCAANELRIRWDSNENGQIDPVTGAGNDTLVRYYRNNNDLEYYPDYGNDTTTYEVLTKKVVNHLMIPPADIFTCADGVVRIELFLRHDPASAESVENPQLRMISRVYNRSESAN